MATTFNDNIQNNSPKPLDNKKGKWENGEWRAYNSIAEAISAIDEALRYRTLTVPIKKDSIVLEYWWRDGVGDEDLVLKTPPRDPDWLVVKWSAMSTSNGEGGKSTYINTAWKGYAPKLSVDNNINLKVDVDYELRSEGGFNLLDTSNVPVIYEDQEIWASSFNKL